MTLVPVTWELSKFDYDSCSEMYEMSIGTFLLGPCYIGNKQAEKFVGELFGAGSKGRCKSAKLEYIQEIFKEAKEIAPLLGLDTDDRAYALLASML